MKYLKFKMPSEKGMESSKTSALEKILAWLLEKFIPEANPDFDHLYDFVETWYIEYDETSENDGVCREVGRNAFGRIIIKTPDDRNYGYWNDTNMGIGDFIEQMHAEFISQEEFESAWNEELVRVDRELLNT